jgi:hypothetical protein
MMGESFKVIQYLLFPKTIKYKRSKDVAKVSTNGITLQVTKTPDITAADFRAEMAEKWQELLGLGLTDSGHLVTLYH